MSLISSEHIAVRHTFWELVDMSLKEKDFECRRNRALSDSMIGFPECLDDATTAASTCADSSDETESDAGSADTISTSYPRMPPGTFSVCVPHAQEQRQTNGRTKKMGLWANSVKACDKLSTNTKTTLLIKNVHTESKRDDLCRLLDVHGFKCQYDFIYVPANFKTMSSFGYAFVNFVNSVSAQQAMECFDDFAWTFGQKISTLEVTWSDPHQGLEIHVERYRNCPVMHSTVSDEYKPMLLRNGTRVAFPAPTKALSAPRDVRRKQVGKNEKR